VEVGAQNILPIGENAQEAVGRVAEFDETAGSVAGSRGSRNGAVLRTCEMSVSGPIH
jgi:hypothetical protein